MLVRNVRIIGIQLCLSLNTRNFGMISTKKGVINRFYKQVSITQNNSERQTIYHVLLDNHYLKTPKGAPLKLDSIYLAELVALEWVSQSESVETSKLYFTKLLSYSQDTPVTNNTRYDLIGQLNFDTVRVWCPDSEEVFSIQKQKYYPLIQWFNNTYKTTIEEVGTLSPTLNRDTQAKFTDYLLTMPDTYCIGLKYGADACKSVILMLALTESQLSPNDVVELGLLEMNYQVKKWGTVEWAHEVDRCEILTRVCVGALIATAASKIKLK